MPLTAGHMATRDSLQRSSIVPEPSTSKVSPDSDDADAETPVAESSLKSILLGQIQHYEQQRSQLLTDSREGTLFLLSEQGAFVINVPHISMMVRGIPGA